jgi:hypothetical protein
MKITKDKLKSLIKDCLVEEGKEFDYMLLGRLQQDCDYYLGNGNRSPKSLWAESEEGQIAKMKELYNKMDEKPEWISMEDINAYELAMLDGVLGEGEDKFADDVYGLCYPEVKEGADVVVQFILDNTMYNVREPFNITWSMISELNKNQRAELASLLPKGSIVEEATHTGASAFAMKAVEAVKDLISIAAKETGGDVKTFQSDIYEALRSLYTDLKNNASGSTTSFYVVNVFTETTLGEFDSKERADNYAPDSDEIEVMSLVEYKEYQASLNS